MQEASPGIISFNELTKIARKYFFFIIKRWIIIAIVGIIGGILGFGYYFFTPHKYKSVMTFAASESGGGSLGQLGALAAMVGFSGKGQTIFSSDGLMKLLSSRSIIESALLFPMTDSLGRKLTVIEHYINVNNIRESWKNTKYNNVNFSLSKTRESFSKEENEILFRVYESLSKKIIIVRPDKLIDFVRIELEYKDELFAYYFIDALQIVLDQFYKTSKTNQLQSNVNALESRADSIWNVMNKLLLERARYQDQNFNLSKQVLGVQPQKQQIEIQAMMGAYGEIVKSLETARALQATETPLLKVIDKPILPLKDERRGKFFRILYGGFLFGFLAICYYSISFLRFINKNTN